LTLLVRRSYSESHKVAQKMNDISQIVEQVEKRIAEKRARLVALLNDPDLAPYVAVLQNGHKPAQPNKKPSFTPPIGFKNGHGIRDAIRKLLSDEEHPFFEMRQFGRDNVKNFLDSLYGKDAYTDKAVGDALHHLSTSKNRVLKKVGGGEGGKLNLYERI
jgi:hypothetical protein